MTKYHKSALRDNKISAIPFTHAQHHWLPLADPPSMPSTANHDVASYPAHILPSRHHKLLHANLNIRPRLPVLLIKLCQEIMFSIIRAIIQKFLEANFYFLLVSN